MWARLHYDRWADETKISKRNVVTSNQKKTDDEEWWKPLNMIPQMEHMKEMLFKNMDHLKHIVEPKKK